jgi:hypothetical protein
VPAAAVIPAPRAYIRVVAVKKLVVGPWGDARPKLREAVAVRRRPRGGARSSRFLRRRAASGGVSRRNRSTGCVPLRRIARFYFE